MSVDAIPEAPQIPLPQPSIPPIPHSATVEDSTGTPSTSLLGFVCNESSSQDWSQQVQEWIRKRAEAEHMPPPPPETDNSSRLVNGNGFLAPPIPDLPALQPSSDAAAVAARVAAAAANLSHAALPISGFSPALEPPPTSGFSRPQSQLRTSRSRSRRRRSSSRRSRSQRLGGRSQSRRSSDNRAQDSRRSRSREVNPMRSRTFQTRDREATHMESRPAQTRDREANPMESRTIQIIEGVVRSRLTLKAEMERFGRVEVCYMGNRHDPSAEPPMVRFEKAVSADLALQAINSGQVVFDGGTAKAVFKRGGRTAPPPRQATQRNESILDITSRDIAYDDRRRRGTSGR